MRERQLIVTRRGRGGGSFVAGQADPLAAGRAALEGMSRLALRDLGAHYAAIESAAVRMAARRVTEDESDHVRGRLERLDPSTAMWRRALDDVQVEIIALSHSARLTREHMKLQVELSPLVRLLDVELASRRAQQVRLLAVLEAIEEGDENAAAERAELLAAALVSELIASAASAPHRNTDVSTTETTARYDVPQFPRT